MKHRLSHSLARRKVVKKIWLVMFFLLTSCTASVGDQISITKTSDCVLPCWNSIVAGQTKEQDAVQIISSLSFIDKESVLITKKPWNIFDNQIFFSFTARSGFKNKNPRLSEIDVLDGLVRVFTLCGELHTTMGEIVQEIGEPEMIVSGGSIAGGRDVILIKPKEGVSYWYNTKDVPKAVEFEINQQIEVQCLSLFDPAIFEELLDAGMFSMGHYNAEETMRVIYPWAGYGNLDEKYPPRQP
jgi:hypothetical protein